MIEAKITVKAESSYMLDLMIGDVMREISRGRFPKEMCYRGKNYISVENIASQPALCYQSIVDKINDSNPPGERIMQAFEDPKHIGNSKAYHTGEQCIEDDCTEPAGTAWSKHWCFEHNVERIKRIGKQLEDIRGR